MEHDKQGGILVLESRRDCDVIYAAAKIGFGNRGEMLLRSYRSIPDSELPARVSDVLALPAAYGLAKIAIREVASQIIQPDEAETYLREVFQTSSNEQMAPALPYLTE
jgi:hypothetical protein